MAEYIIDVNNADEEHVKLTNAQAETCFGHPLKEQIVRCKDCRFYTDKPGLSGEKPNRKYCTKYSDWDSEWDYDTYHYVEPDGFCKWGEPREA